MDGIAHDYVVENFNFQQLACSNEITSDFDVCLGWSRITARMIVLCDAPVYVQLVVPGGEAPALLRRKGVSCLKANHSCGLAGTQPFAN